MKKDFTRKIVITLVAFVSLLSGSIAFAQGLTVSGTVVDGSGLPVIAASVQIEGTTLGVVTDIDGQYTINNVPANASLVFGALGFNFQTVQVAGRSTINVILEEDTELLDELVVIGYGTVRKRDLTGAVAVVDTKAMSKAPAVSVLESLQGSLPGVEISMNGRPGDTGYATIRGINSFTNVNPLFVIDGLPTTNIRDFNAADIESIQVLKDASSAAIYGSRAANGVIVITTKKGAGATKVNFSTSYTIQHQKKLIDFARANEWVELQSIAHDNQKIFDPGATPIYPTLESGQDTDWWDEIYRNGSIQQYNLSISGGSESANYYLSGEYYKNKGVVYGSGYDRFNIRVNTGGKKGIFSFGESLIISNNLVDPTQGNTVGDMLAMCPVIGRLQYGGVGNASMGDNPLLREELNEVTQRNIRIQGTVWGELAFTEWLKYKLNLGYNMNISHNKTLRKDGSTRWNQAVIDPSITESRGLEEDQLVEHTLTFDKKFGKHAVTFMAGMTYQHIKGETLSTQAMFPAMNSLGEYFNVIDMCESVKSSNGSVSEYAMLSYLGRLTYSYDDRYLMNATFRRDGTSKVASDKRWGNFPSISAAWRISKESFMQDVKGIDDLKLRVSYGELGGMNIGNWDYLALINTNLRHILGTDQHLVNAASQTKMVNTDLKWETQTQINFGVDAAFLANRLTASVDYYISKADNLLLQMPILVTTGNNGGNPYVNAANMENRGFELALGWREAINDFNYYAQLSATTGKNKVTSLGYGQDYVNNGVGRTEIGKPIGMFFLYPTDGIFQSEAEVQAHKNSQGVVIQPKAMPGDIKFIDTDDNGVINDADRIMKDEWTPHSKLQLGLNAGFSYKNFDVKMNWFGDFGSKIYNAIECSLGAYNDAHSNKLHKEYYWSETNKNAPYPRLLEQTVNNKASDFWLRSGNYFKLKTLTISYSLPTVWLSKVNVDNCTLSFTTQNLICFGSLPFADIEFRKDNIWQKGNRGTNAYPNPTSYLFGISFQF